MKGKKLFEKIGEVKEEFIQDTAESLYGAKKQDGRTDRSPRYIFIVAAVVAVCVLASGIGINMQRHREKDKIVSLPNSTMPGNSNKKEKDSGSDSVSSKGYKVQQVQSVVYPDKNSSLESENLYPDNKYLKNLEPFYQQTISDIMAGGNGENVAYSPVNLYLCMAMLAEITDGQTQKQLLDALGQESVADVRKQSKNIWNSIYLDNGISKCILGDSIWLNDKVSYDKDVLKILADNYYTSTYQGKMGTKSMDKTIQDWINHMTGDALKEQAGRLETSARTVFMLLSSACFYDQWGIPFAEEYTKKSTFYNADGSVTKCDFMKKISNMSFYEEERFCSVLLGFESGQCMAIFLPNEGTTLEEMLEKDMKKILNISTDESYKGIKWGEVTLSLPKFQITTSHLDLIPAMQNMGITDIFEPGAGFGRFVDENQMDGLFVNKVQQSTKVAVDENGCSIASYTEVEMRDGAGAPDKEFTLNCNRPFLFVISNVYEGIPVFAGVVNEIE